MSALMLLTAVLATSPAPEPHALTAYVQSGASLYLSNAQTAGGIGGGVGVRLHLSEPLFLQADLSYLGMLGNSFRTRVAAGFQRTGTWRPAVRLGANVLTGDRLRFFMGDRITPVSVPTWSLGLTVAPLRFATSVAEVSVLELGAGLGWDFPGLGTSIDVTILEVGVRF